MDQLFGLSRVSWSDERVALGWRTELPAWAWALLVLAAVAFSAWSYHRLLGARWARIALVGIRAVLILILIALLAGPMLVLRQDRVDPDCLIILVDRSASLQIRDMYASGTLSAINDETRAALLEAGIDPSHLMDLPAEGVLISRDEAMEYALLRHAMIFGDDHLGGEHRDIIWLGFDSATYELGPREALIDPERAGQTGVPMNEADLQAQQELARALPVPDLGPAQGQATRIRTAIEQAMQRAGGRPISGIVLLSDGRSSEATSADLVRRLNQQGVSIFTVPLGGMTSPLDLSIASIDAPQRAFVDDIIPVNVMVEAFPADAEVDFSRIRVTLSDEQTGEVLDERYARSSREPVRLTARSEAVGRMNWKVEIEYEGTIAGEQVVELITENNSELVSLELTDRPIRVLYVEAYPRWEYRYLKNMLVREESISSSMMLLSADRRFAQEGDVPLARLPRDAEEFEPYDVVIIGDVPSNYFGAELMTLIRDHVAIRGAGLLWIGGPSSTPRTYETTPLADLLPMRMPGAVDRLGQQQLIAMMPTELADSFNVMRLASHRDAPTILPGQDELDEDGWPALEPLHWAQDLGALKQIAQVLAEARDHDALTRSSAEAETGPPLVVRMPYGAGLTLYVATDETWRWRYGRGEFYFEPFWLQLVRMLGANRLQQDTGPAHLAVSTRRVERDQAVVVDLVVRDPRLLQEHLPRIALDVVRADDPDARPIERIELQPDLTSGGDLEQAAIDPMVVTRGRTYTALWQPSVTGSLRLQVAASALEEMDLFAQVEVFHADDELRQPLPDRDRLEALAQQTGGRLIELDDLGELAAAGVIPNRQIRTPNDIREPLWDSYLSLLAVLTLLTVEWVGRKIIRLV